MFQRGSECFDYETLKLVDPRVSVEGLVEALDLATRMGTQRDMELVAQEQVLDDKVVPSAKEPGQCAEEEAG